LFVSLKFSPADNQRKNNNGCHPFHKNWDKVHAPIITLHHFYLPLLSKDETTAEVVPWGYMRGKRVERGNYHFGQDGLFEIYFEKHKKTEMG